MKKLRIFWVVALVIMGLGIFLVPSPIHGIAQPDSPLQVNSVEVFSFSDGSAGVLIDSYVDYTAPYPDETATESILAIFIDTDGATQLKAVAPYTYVNSGYLRNLIWIPFTEDEATSYGLDSAQQANYRVWLTGNPTLAWDGGIPPKTIVTIDEWTTTGDMNVLLALRVLYYADQLELAWSVDMIEATALGNKLTTAGDNYFQNVIDNCRELAPAAFAAGTAIPTLYELDYSSAFSAVVTSNTTTVVGSPVTLVNGTETTITTAGATGNITVTFGSGTYGTIESIVGTIASSPSDLIPGVNYVTVTGLGTVNITAEWVSPTGVAEREVIGTGFDLTALATIFGMSRLMFSGLVWFVITLVICAAAYGFGRKGAMGQPSQTPGTLVMFLFGLCLVGGALLGMLDMKVVALFGIAQGALIGYVFFFRTGTGDIGRVVMFFGWMMFVVSLMGGLQAGYIPQTSTVLTANVTAADTTISVTSTDGLSGKGTIRIGTEHITYSNLTSTTIGGTFWHPTVRGADGTDAAAHSEGDPVRTVESFLLNDALNYSLAQLSDASGIMLFLTVPLVLWDIITTFIFLPFAFLGTDFSLLTYIWGIMALGLVVSFFIALAGGRRV